MAQNPLSSKVIWSCSQFTDLVSNESVTSSCQFVSDGDKSVQWIQKGGSLVYDFEIIQFEGSWSDVESLGSINYKVKLGSSAGSINFSRKGSSLIVLMQLEGESGKIYNEYLVSKVQVTQ